MPETENDPMMRSPLEADPQCPMTQSLLASFTQKRNALVQAVIASGCAADTEVVQTAS